MSEETPAAVFQMAEYRDADETLRIVRQSRLGLMDLQMQHGLMTDKDDFAMFHANLAALSADANREKQLKQEEKSSEMIQALAIQASEDLARKMGIALFTSQAPIDVSERTAGLSEIVGIAAPADGELYVGTDVRTFDEFSSTVGAELERRRRGEPEPTPPTETPSDSP